MHVKKKKIRVVELFAGVGGFRLGLQQASDLYEVIWSNQWEPATKRQHASEAYISAFGEQGHSNVDIAQVLAKNIPDHDLLVGGFPCQDYSVARTLSQAAGLGGKKGVLWWEIHRIIKEKGRAAPDFLLLENVDRLVKSPASQRGRDFAIMLTSLSDLGYIVEWRIINAADYGMPQRRRRIYILAYKKDSKYSKKVLSFAPEKWLSDASPFTKAFPINTLHSINNFAVTGTLGEISSDFNKKKEDSPFLNSGIMISRKVWTTKYTPKYNGPKTYLKDILYPESKIPAEYFLSEKDMKVWRKLKGAKKEIRKTKGGFEYQYSEGAMVFPDSLDNASRTIVTGEGGSTPSRFKHVIETKSGRYRRLIPEELELLNMFPAGHTKGHTPTKRAFFMGNALVVGVIERIAKQLL